ncbi:hypothetical protein F2Q69_00024853 [Brassica cretica]|uniref:Uncharacterized protein n=1 Tax=Brassica cretica TaxID=69181 RepID=A0A8S9QAT5_BRACR|nr:hypothetical protein F2Q69_00024853 [Brassica cretica]
MTRTIGTTRLNSVNRLINLQVYFETPTILPDQNPASGSEAPSIPSVVESGCLVPWPKTPRDPPLFLVDYSREPVHLTYPRRLPQLKNQKVRPDLQGPILSHPPPEEESDSHRRWLFSHHEVDCDWSWARSDWSSRRFRSVFGPLNPADVASSLDGRPLELSFSRFVRSVDRMITLRTRGSLENDHGSSIDQICV